MKVRVLLFASLRERAGRSRFEVEVEADCRVEGLLRQLENDMPFLREVGRFAVAVNEDYAGPERPLRENDEIALIPPVSGG